MGPLMTGIKTQVLTVVTPALYSELSLHPDDFIP